VLRERNSFTIPDAPTRGCLISDAVKTAIELELANSRVYTKARYQAWIVLLVMQDTGMRPSEVLEMRLENLHWAERRVWIPSGKSAKARRFVADDGTDAQAAFGMVSGPGRAGMALS